MLETIIPKIKGFLFDPVVTFQTSRTDETRTVISCFGILLMFYAVLAAAFEMLLLFLSFLLSAGSAGTGGMSSQSPETALVMVFVLPVLLFFTILVGGSLFMFVFSLWTHLWVYLLGGRKGFRQTLHALLYSMTPNLLLGWIPLIGMFASIWALILMFFGIRELQEMSDGRTIGILLLSVILPLIVLAVIFVLAIVYLASGGGLFPPYSSIQ
jgi:hypothetical protein